MGHDTLIILGSGYTARFVWPLALRHYAHAFATSREPNKKLHHVAPEQRIRFDLTKPDTWRNIPGEADLLWCFPAAPPELVKQFAGAAQVSARRLVVLGSTSAYDVGNSQEYPPPWINESAPIDLTKPRVQGEEFLRSDCGAIVLRIVGIYGPGRNPIDWIKTGRVGPSRKYVNLIHVEDLAAICLAALEHGKPGDAYNVSDGAPRTWRDICDVAEQRWGIGLRASGHEHAVGKRIRNDKLLATLGLAHDLIRHSNLVQSLQQIQDQALRPSAAPSP